jgi:TPR repeat protein
MPADGVVRILGVDNPITLDKLRDPRTGAYLAPVRPDGGPVSGLPEGQAAPLFAVVDTGMDLAHPWIAATLVESVDLTGQGEADRNGHGTWVALEFLRYCPMPVGLLNVKALGDNGTGTPDALARGIRWAARQGATAINVSAGVYQPSCQGDCLVCRAALAASDAGILVSAAAGNEAGITTCPAKAAFTHPQSRVVAGGSANIGGSGLASYSGQANYYFPDHILFDYLLPVPPAGDDPGSRGPKYRAAAADSLIRQAIGMNIRGDLPTALRDLDEATARYGADPDPEARAHAARALVNKGSMLRQHRRFSEEIPCYAAVIDRYATESDDRIRREVGSARSRRASALERQSDAAGALADYTAIIRDIPLTPDMIAPNRLLWKEPVWAFLDRGTLLRKLRRQQEADADFESARPWLELAAQRGHTDAMTALGSMIQDSDPSRARSLWKQAAEGGELDAIYNLGVLLTKSDPAAARSWYEKAARLGKASAAYNLAFMLQHSDPAAARAWCEVAVNAGHAGAMYFLASMLQTSDLGTAMSWYQKAAEAGVPEAMHDFGVLLLDSDPAAARTWLERAAAAGDAAAIERLKPPPQQ